MTGIIGFWLQNGVVPRVARTIQLDPHDRLELDRWVSAHGTPQQVTQRCRIVLEASAGHQDKDIANTLQINVKTVALWRGRFLKEGMDCLWEVASGRGRKPLYAADKVAEVIETTLQSRPAGATH